MEFQRKWRKIDRKFQRAAYNSKIQLRGGSVAGRKTFSGKKCPVKRNTFRGKRTHKLTGPGRTVGVVRTGRRGEEEVERVCSDRHETCTLYLQLLEPYHL